MEEEERANQAGGTLKEKSASVGKRMCFSQAEHTEPEINVCTWLDEVYCCSFLTTLPGPAWVLLSYVLQTFILGSV